VKCVASSLWLDPFFLSLFKIQNSKFHPIRKGPREIGVADEGDLLAVGRLAETP
jgi:hypothetical protein